MPIDAKHNPFKPQQPTIPGVPREDPDKKKAALPSVSAEPKPKPWPPTASRPRPTDDRRGQMLAITVCLGGCVVVAMGLIAWKLHQPARAAVSPSSMKLETGLGEPHRPPSNWPIAPGVVASEAELAKPWASKEFSYRDPILDREIPAIVVHLPHGGYWGFSLIEPFGSCQLEYVTNLERLRTFYHFAADHPMVGNPCNRAVFDLLQYGGPPGAEVRGARVQGMGARPPIAIEIEQRGKEIFATKME